MTTIAWDGRFLAADTLGMVGEHRHQNPVNKLVVQAGNVYACAGVFALFRPFIDWHRDGADARLYPGRDGVILIALHHGAPEVFCNDTPYPQPVDLIDAWGTGCEFAIGAMLGGKTAPEAVAIAIQANQSSGGNVRFVDTHRSPLEVQEWQPGGWLTQRPCDRERPGLEHCPRLGDRGGLVPVIERPRAPGGVWGMPCKLADPDQFGMGCGICYDCRNWWFQLKHEARPDEIEWEHHMSSQTSGDVLHRGEPVAILATPRFRAAVRGLVEGAAKDRGRPAPALAVVQAIGQARLDEAHGAAPPEP